ncbi:MAG: preprotein translocase subunit SecA [Jiangellales bacterium]
MATFFDRLMRAGEGKILKRLTLLTAQVNRLEDDMVGLSDAELRALTGEYQARARDGESLDDLLPEAFATVREAAKRTLGQRHYDVQIMGGAALHLGNIAEMKTGEGKTLVSTLPAYLNALAGDGVHVVTVNDYLASRDSDWMGRVHRFLGLSVGTILAQMPPATRREQYAADITYGTNNEFGFDYLRDNMAMMRDDLVQRGHHFAIVDEVDSILIDEARTPLIISGPADQPTKWYSEFSRLAASMERDVDYEVDEKKRTVGILEPGIATIEDHLGIDNLYESANTPLIQYLNNSIKAKELYRRDKEYIVMDGEVLIVDEHTGRVLSGRRYSEGMHQAIEAKESVEIKQENQTLATVTLQNFFRLYEKLGGMTGTAMTEASEFDKIYGLGVVPIPTNRDMVRLDKSDFIYRTVEAKFDAAVTDIVERHRKGQPVLVGTASVQTSEQLSTLLSGQGIVHEVLNAKQHAREATIVAQAGRRGAVTVATNMAGRGTDITLGGNPEVLAAQELADRGLDPAEDAEAYEDAWTPALEKYSAQVKAEHDEVTALGGLYVIGTERHESRRIDNQLRGRSGRQGDPGESRFYISLQDDLMRRFGGALGLMDRALGGLGDDSVPLESKTVSRTIERAQSQAEAQYFEIRKDVLKYDDVLNAQREVIYAERRRVLDGEDMADQIRHMIDDVVEEYVRAATSEGYPESWDLEKLWTSLRTLYPITLTVAGMEQEAGGREGLTSDFLVTAIVEDAQRSYVEREAELSPPVMRELERRVVLTVLDRRWREHLYEMDYLREGIGLRAMAQRNPLVEYQREGYDMFSTMMDGIKEESVGLLFHVEVQQPEPTTGQAEGAGVLIADGLVSAKAPAQLEYTAPTVDGAGEVMHRTVAASAANGADAGGESDSGEAAEGNGDGRTRGRRTRSKGRRR